MAQRYQREIEEILDKTNEGSEKAGSNKSTAFRRQPRGSRGRASRFRLGFTSSNLLAAGVLVLLVALLGGFQPLMWVGITLLVVAYVSYFNKPRRSTERRWRGESIEIEPQPGIIQRLWSWMTRT